ncbi:MAG: hypothetical protein M1838_002570 [Thelocarpon superellum]|nr:MAG: hypothetical protein M1838_002570 [Thelocarpon superellum]
MGISKFLVPFLVGTAQAAYTLQDVFNTTNFLQEFEFWMDPDPTHGTVTYVNQSVAEQYNLFAIKQSSLPGTEGQNNTWFAGHDGTFNTSLAVSPQRPSTRLSSRKRYDKGLFLADIAHMPLAECGVWPAFWTAQVDPWPAGGEIDIIEGADEQTANKIALHTGDNCSMDQGYSQSIGVPGPTDCAVSTSYTGCTEQDKNPGSYGQAFNDGEGGVYAMEWNSDHIAVWWWARRDIPADVTSGNPDPTSWATPVARFKGSCDIDSHFSNHQIIFDITFCGDLAGQTDVWGATCAGKHQGMTCSDYVMSSTDGFKQAYWEIVSLKVYQDA